MSKKYTIVNTGLDGSNLGIDNFFYIVIFILAIYLGDKSDLIGKN